MLAAVKRRALKRKQRVRKAIKDVNKSDRVRLSVFRSNKHIYAQLIDDLKGCTVASASTLNKDGSGEFQGRATLTLESARAVGRAIAAKAKEMDLEMVVFDKGPYKYHGRIKALAEAAREAMFLKF